MNKQAYKSPVILIAEDDENVSMAINSILSRKYSCDVVVVRDGQQAWEKIQHGGIDLIISDWNMPNKSGDELLLKVRNSEKSRYTPFIMLTARSDKQSVMTALNSGVSNYISKPFSKNDVLEKVALYIDDKVKVNKGQGDSMTETGHEQQPDAELRQTVENYMKAPGFEVPVLPDIIRDMVTLLNDKKASADDLCDLIAKDAELSMRLIRICNSIYFNGKEIINNLHDAVVRLGIKETENYAMMIAQEAMVETNDSSFQKIINKYWQHAYATAVCARYIAESLKLPGKEAYFTMGLLHDIGKFLLIKILIEFTGNGEKYSEETILKLLASSHERAGGLLLKKWGFPVNYVEAATNHHMIQSGGQESSSMLVINLADTIVRKLGYSLVEKASIDIKNIESAKALMIGARDINNIIVNVEEDVSKFPSVA